MIFRSHGCSGDPVDQLHVSGSFENPARWEDTVRQAHVAAKSDKALAGLLDSIYLQEDRAQAFAAYSGSEEAAAIAGFIARFGISPTSAICDVGCGPGHLGYALHQRGFGDVTCMDPNGERFTGTGYLRARLGTEIAVVNDLAAWRQTAARFDAVVSKATIHHWNHIPLVAIDVRRTMKPGAFWFAFGEYFANSPRELEQAITRHPTASRYGSYEWAYPPAAYVDLIQSVGLNLVAVVPYFYRRNALVGSMRPVPPDIDLDLLDSTVDAELVAQGGTVDRFWDEVDRFRRQDHGHRIFTEPQVLVFQRVAV
jgi:SAM-dependent methyltransferase